MSGLVSESERLGVAFDYLSPGFYFWSGVDFQHEVYTFWFMERPGVLPCCFVQPRRSRLSWLLMRIGDSLRLKGVAGDGPWPSGLCIIWFIPIDLVKLLLRGIMDGSFEEHCRKPLNIQILSWNLWKKRTRHSHRWRGCCSASIGGYMDVHRNSVHMSARDQDM